MDHALQAVVDHLEVLDIALVQQDLSDALLHVGSGDVNGVVLGTVGVADAGEHIRNRIGDMHVKSSYFQSCGLISRSGSEVSWRMESPLARSTQFVMTFRHPLCQDPHIKGPWLQRS